MEAVDCDCSICTMKGAKHAIVPASKFEFMGQWSDVAEYRFGTGLAKHYFCAYCGIAPFYVPRSNPSGYGINMNCVERSNIESVSVISTGATGRRHTPTPPFQNSVDGWEHPLLFCHSALALGLRSHPDSPRRALRFHLALC